MSDQDDPYAEYVERRIRRAAGIRALKQIRDIIGNIEETERASRTVAMYLVAVFLVIVLIMLVLWLR